MARTKRTPTMKRTRQTVVKTTERKPKTSKKMDENCAICQDTIKNVATLDSCCHKYCKECIQTWAKTENSCPQCKAKFTTITALKKGCKKKTVSTRVENRRQPMPSHYQLAPLGRRIIRRTISVTFQDLIDSIGPEHPDYERDDEGHIYPMTQQTPTFIDFSGPPLRGMQSPIGRMEPEMYTDLTTGMVTPEMTTPPGMETPDDLTPLGPDDTNLSMEEIRFLLDLPVRTVTI